MIAIPNANTLTTAPILFESEKVVLRKLGPNIHYLHFKKGSDIEEEDIIELYMVNSKMAERYPHHLLVTIGIGTNIDVKARKLTEIYKVNIVREAIVVDNLPKRIMVRFILKYRVSDHPTKVFATVQEALAYLQSHQSDFENLT